MFGEFAFNGIIYQILYRIVQKEEEGKTRRLLKMVTYCRLARLSVKLEQTQNQGQVIQICFLKRSTTCSLQDLSLSFKVGQFRVQLWKNLPGLRDFKLFLGNFKKQRAETEYLPSQLFLQNNITLGNIYMEEWVWNRMQVLLGER